MWSEVGYNDGKNRVARNTWLRLCIQLQSSCWSLGNCSGDSRELKDEVTAPQTPTRCAFPIPCLAPPFPRYGLTFIFMYESCCSRKHRQCCTIRAHRDDKIKHPPPAEKCNFIRELHLDREYLFCTFLVSPKLYAWNISRAYFWSIFPNWNLKTKIEEAKKIVKSCSQLVKIKSNFPLKSSSTDQSVRKNLFAG